MGIGDWREADRELELSAVCQLIPGNLVAGARNQQYLQLCVTRLGRKLEPEPTSDADLAANANPPTMRLDAQLANARPRPVE